MISPDRLHADPHWFPQNLDWAEGELVLIPTSRDRLSSQPFMDGRSDFSMGEPQRLSLSQALAGSPEQVPQPDRMIFHVGFCGSTLLATVLDQPGRTFVLREPNLLAELAGAHRDGVAIDEALSFARRLLRRRWSPNEFVVCKPSNWVNNLLPQFVSEPTAVRPLFMTMNARSFLVAAFRGGRDRLAFLIRLAAHLSSALEDGPNLWRIGSVTTADPLDRAARLVLLAHELQMRLFAAAQAHGRWDDKHCLEFSEVQRDLPAAAGKASRALGLSLSGSELARAVRLMDDKHAKQTGLHFSAARRVCQDRDVEQHHGSRINAALAWGRSAFTH